jgi:peroxiredoxin
LDNCRTSRLATALCFALLLALQGCSRTAPAAAPEVGHKAPAFETVSVDGKRLRFPADTANKVVLIRFWAERCPHCEAEMRELEPVFQKLQGEGFAILAINAGQSRATAESFARKHGLSYAMLLDEDSLVGKRYGVTGIPTSFMVDRHGVVRAKFVGQTPKGEFEQSAQSLLKP